MKKRLSAFPTKGIQNFGLLIAFVLLVAASSFASDHPVLTSLLVFAFSLAYLAASVVTRRASLLYATMLLGAVSYFMACHALGAPGTSFPLLSVPLVAALFLVGHKLRKRLADELADFPPTVFRAMDITAAVFAVWALVQVGGLMEQPGVLRYVAPVSLLSFAVIYFLHCVAIGKRLCVYAFSAALALGTALVVVVEWGIDFAWIPTIASAGLILLAGTTLNRTKPSPWSRHFYFAAAAVTFVSLVLAMARWQFFVLDMAIASLLFWAAYGWLEKAVPDVLHAASTDRVTAKVFFFGSLGIALPVVPLIFILPTNPYVAVAAMVCGLTLSWLVWHRRNNVMAESNVRYALGAVMFVTAGVTGLAAQLPDWTAWGWALILPVGLLVTLAAVQSAFGTEKHSAIRRALAGAVVFPAMFAWFVPLLLGQSLIALIAAGVALVVIVVLSLRQGMNSARFGWGPAMAGVVVCGAMLLAGLGLEAWGTCAVATALAGALFAWADARGRALMRGSAHLAWLALSLATMGIAGAVGFTQLLYASTVVGAISALIMGRTQRVRTMDVFERLVQITAALTAFAAVVVCGPFSDAGPALMGLCMLALAGAYWAAWALGRGVWSMRLGTGLMSLGALLVIYGNFPGAEWRLALGAGLVAALFTIASATARKAATISHSAVIAGHMTAIVLALAALIQAWPGAGGFLPVWAGTLVFLYALAPNLRNKGGMRGGAILWLSFVALFAICGLLGTPYPQQVHLLVLVAVAWLVAGQLLGRTAAKAWSMPMYVCAAVVAGFCCIVEMFSPAQGGTWPVFMVSGMIFATLFIILRQDAFAYLLTLALALLAYDWVKSSTSPFTQDVLFYLVIGGVVLAAAFLLPHIRRILSRTESVPVFAIFTKRGALLLSAVVVGFSVLLLSAYSMKLTGHPKFCTSCHNMDQYYSSWQHSAHKDVACISCHYEPGVANTMKGKVEGLVQVVKYVSHAYSTKPHALIANASCMRSSCHSEMDHSTETKLFKGQIAFRHDIHLSDHPRGQELNCVTCHGQTVEGKHISVSSTACVTCHFYGRDEQAVATGKCQTCHRMPDKTVTFMGQKFDHEKFLKNKPNAQCSHCHSQVTQGDGAISSTRCRSCHLGEKDLKVGDQAKFHLTHVSKGHFDCLQCHDEIKHGERPKGQKLLAAGNCKTCHTGERHSIQEKVYAGTVVPGMKTRPDVMYKAGVACDGCHTEVKITGVGSMPFTMKASGSKQCVDCHGKQRYGKMLAEWQESTKDMLAEHKPALEALTRELRVAKGPADQMAQAEKLLKSARTKLSLVIGDGSFGAHNAPYIEDILFSVEEDLDAAKSLMAQWDKPALSEGRP